jgi:tetratricopeptide (TPR) repeat protein
MVDSSIYLHKKRVLNLLCLILLAFLFTSVFAISFFLERIFPLEKEKIFYLPPLDSLKVISGTFHSFCADIFYIRGVLAITDEFEDRSSWVNWVQKNFDVAVSLDPKLTQAYFFAGVVVARDKEGIQKGIQFLEKGIKLNPDEWQIPYWIGFNYYQLGDYLKAVEYYQEASELAGAPKFLKSIQPMYYYKAGRPDLGLMYLEGLLHSIKDPKQLQWIKIKLKWLKNIIYLEEKIGQFKEIHHRLPEGLEELVEVGLMKEIPEDPFGTGYYLDKDSGRIKSRFGFSVGREFSIHPEVGWFKKV